MDTLLLTLTIHWKKYWNRFILEETDILEYQRYTYMTVNIFMYF